MKKQFVRCIMTAKDGQRCGRMGPADTQICSVHSRASQSPIIPTEIDELSILKKLARSANEQIKLRAVDLLLALKAKAKPEAAPGTDDYGLLLLACTAAEREELIALIGQFKAIKERIYARRPDLRPAGARPAQRAVGSATYVPPDPSAAPLTPAVPPPPDPDELIEVMTSKGPRLVTRRELDACEV